MRIGEEEGDEWVDVGEGGGLGCARRGVEKGGIRDRVVGEKTWVVMMEVRREGEINKNKEIRSEMLIGLCAQLTQPPTSKQPITQSQVGGHTPP